MTSKRVKPDKKAKKKNQQTQNWGLESLQDERDTEEGIEHTWAERFYVRQ